MKPGYIMLARRTFDHALWTENRSFSKFEAWLDLLQLAAYLPTKRIIRGQWVEIGRGEMVASLRYLAERWNWKKDKVASFLGLIENDQMIRRETRQSETIIIVCNYERYNRKDGCDPDTVPDTKPTATRQPPDKVEEDKEEERERTRVGTNGNHRRPTLSQAKSAATNLGITPDKADEWWHAREASDWMKGMAGGGTSPVGSNWQADLKTYSSRGGMGQTGHNGSQNRAALSPGNSKPIKFID